MSTLRRLFTAPGNARIWLSLTFYVSALAAILIYADRIGRKAADAFQQLTTAPDAGVSVEEVVAPLAQADRAASLPPGEREARLLALSREGNEEATRALERIVRLPKQAVVSAALAQEARSDLDSGTRAERTIAAGLLLAFEGVAIEPSGLKRLSAVLRARRGPTGKTRLAALERMGWLGLWGLRSGRAEQAALRLLTQAKDQDARAEAARALGRIGDPAFFAPLLRRIHDREPPRARAAAVSALLDLGLANTLTRSRVLRALAASIADRDVTGTHAEHVWRTLRALAAEGRRPTARPPEGPPDAPNPRAVGSPPVAHPPAPAAPASGAP